VTGADYLGIVVGCREPCHPAKPQEQSKNPILASSSLTSRLLMLTKAKLLGKMQGWLISVKYSLGPLRIHRADSCTALKVRQQVILKKPLPSCLVRA
jgi:hypothetical protein